jgi:hypothetical protein
LLMAVSAVAQATPSADTFVSSTTPAVKGGVKGSQDFQGDSTDFSACFGACSRSTLLLVSATSCKVEVAHRSFAMCGLCESVR